MYIRPHGVIYDQLKENKLDTTKSSKYPGNNVVNINNLTAVQYHTAIYEHVFEALPR